MLHHDKIITQGGAIELLTGKGLEITDPITGKSSGFSFKRNYGCNTAICSEHLITFRSAAAGYFDLRNNSGTGNFGGFKSSCTANLIAAGGILNAPDYTRTCNCAYQNQTSLAFVHMPDVETWTFNVPKRKNKKTDKIVIQRLGLNFGAPGDRITDDGTLWLEWPFIGGPTRDIPVTSTPETVQTFSQHSLTVKGMNPLKWVAASGITGLNKLSVDLGSKGTYTIKLVFLSQKVKPFNVSLNGKTVLTRFSPSSGTSNDGTVVRTFKGIAVDGTLELTFSKGEPVISGLEIIKE